MSHAVDVVVAVDGDVKYVFRSTMWMDEVGRRCSRCDFLIGLGGYVRAFLL
jgi:hypothetical protein